MNLVVHKFGGAALANAESIRHAVDIIRKRARGATIVASAMRGVTDALLDIGALAGRGDRSGARNAIAALRERHLAAARELTDDATLLSTITDTIDAELDELTDIVKELAAKRAPPAPDVTDRIVARGERLSARLLAAAL